MPFAHGILWSGHNKSILEVVVLKKIKSILLKKAFYKVKGIFSFI